MSPEKILLLGNCQEYPLKVLLQSVPEFNERFEIVDDLGPVFLWSTKQVRMMESRYDQADVILTQPLYDNQYGLAATNNLLAWNKSRKQIPIITFPNINFPGFYPFVIRTMVDLDTASVPDANCGIVFICYVGGLSVEQASDFFLALSQNEAFCDIYRTLYELSMEKMEASEITFHSEVNVSHLFRNMYRETKLIHNRWHPTNGLCEFIANGVLSQLGILGRVKVPSLEFWAHDAMPIFPAIRKALGIRFDDHDGFYYQKGILRRTRDYIAHSYAYYGQNPGVVDKTLRVNHEKLTSISGILDNDYARVSIGSFLSW